MFVSKNELRITSIMPKTNNNVPAETNRFNLSLVGVPKKFNFFIIFP
jgi:hypothetical protein